MNVHPQSVRSQWLQLREARHLRAVDIARQVGVTEAQLVASACGAEGPVTARRLSAPWDDVLTKLAGVGPVKTITRNPQAVIEIEGRYANVEFFGAMGQSVGEVDLRIFIQRWRHGYEVVEETKKGARRSLQFFDAHGVAIHKVYVTERTDAAAFDALVQGIVSADQSPGLEVEAPPPPVVPKPDDQIDVAGLREAWRGLKDTHDFFALLGRFGVTRTQALRLAGEDLARRVKPSSFETILNAVASSALPFMVFVGNRGVIQIFTGTIQRVVPVEGWLNVLDPTFNLHVRTDEITEAWVVRKPTVDGVVTALELYAANGDQVALLVGKRKPGQQEDPSWRKLVESLS